MKRNFFETPRGMLALGVFLLGTGLYSAPSMRQSLADIPWEYFPAEVAQHSWGLYEATFFPVAEKYLVAANMVGDMGAAAYTSIAQGAIGAISFAAETPPVAAAAQWYVQTQTNLDEHLSAK